LVKQSHERGATAKNMTNETIDVYSDEELRKMQEESWEYGLPPYLQESLDSYKKALAMEDDISIVFLWGELYGSINSALIDDDAITEEHACFLRKKYLFE
jgi:hypothetical protein